jgi:hypothetical protein
MVRSSRAKGEGDSLSLAFILVFFASPYNRRYMCFLIVLMLGRDNGEVWGFEDILESGCI